MEAGPGGYTCRVHLVHMETLKDLHKRQDSDAETLIRVMKQTRCETPSYLSCPIEA